MDRGQILDRFAGLPLVAHNAKFDLGVIKDAVTEAGLDMPDLRYACSLVMSRRHYDLPSHRLDVVSRAAGVTLDHHHAADRDALACAQIILAMARDVGATSLGDLLEKLDVGWGQLPIPAPPWPAGSSPSY